MFKDYKKEAQIQIQSIKEIYNHTGKSVISNYDKIIFESINLIIELTSITKGNAYIAVEEIFNKIYSREFKEGTTIKSAYSRGKAKSVSTT